MATMDDFTRAMIAAAIQECKERKDDLTVKRVIATARSLWIQWRDLQLEAWAEDTYERVPHTKLHAIEYSVSLLLFERRIFHERPDEDETPYAVAWGIACLRWWFREAREQVPTLHYTDAEVDAMIKPYLPPQQLMLPGFAS